MRILLDECIDRRLAKEFSDYEIKTVPQMGWADIKDDGLLVLAAAEFDVLITVDRNLPFQQNLTNFDLAVIVLQAGSTRLAALKPLVPEILAVLGNVEKGASTVIGESK
jgi:predicted nuclease of predicted toxin-antitoxin system